MKKSIALFAGLAIVAFSFVASEAAEVQIGDFVFGCKTSDGQVRKPQFGDMNGVFYTNIRGQEKACKDAVKRMIANCHQHTRFLRPADNRKYPECLPVFQEQANECAAFFRQEIAKCSGDGGGMKSAETTQGVMTIPEGHEFAGWRYQGGLRNGKPHGRGMLSKTQGPSIQQGEAEYYDGKLRRAVITEKFTSAAPGTWIRYTYNYRNGKAHGRQLSETSSGERTCRLFENGNRIGNC